jgi:hypothetical protein
MLLVPAGRLILASLRCAGRYALLCLHVPACSLLPYVAFHQVVCVLRCLLMEMNFACLSSEAHSLLIDRWRVQGIISASVRSSEEHAAGVEVDRMFAMELNMRLARSRQTLDYAYVQRQLHSGLSMGRMTLWDALELLREAPR